MKRLLKCSAAFISALMFVSNAFAASDLEGHWAKNTINEMMAQGYISGYSDGSVKPDNLITRAEFMSAANKIFDFSEKTDIGFSDIKKSDWFYDTVSIAVGVGYISGYEDNTIKAENYITKQEAVFIVNKIMGYNLDSSYADKFTDGGGIDSWVKGSVGALAKNNIISGYDDGSFRAKNNITRAEAFTVLDRAHSVRTKNKNDGKYADYNLPQEVSNFEEWKKAIMYSIDNLNESLELKIIGFDNSTYDLENLGIVTVGIKAEGSLKNGTATVKYSFDYGENFKMLRAVKDGSLSSKLSSEELEAISFLSDVKDEIIKPDMTDYEKELAIHDYIVLNYEYDYDKKEEGRYNVIDFLKTKKGVCEAYAYSFAILALLSGLDCEMIYGVKDGVNHAWNAVKIDGEFYYIDTTFDDAADEKDVVIYNYFNLNDDTLSKTHTWDKEKNNNIEVKGVKYNYFNYNNSIFENREDFETFLHSRINDKSEVINFYIKNFTLEKSDIKNMLFNISSDISSCSLIGNFGQEGGFTLIIEYKK